MVSRDRRPRYLQLAEELRAQIMSGKLARGAAMPSETQLAESSGLSRTSVRNAIRQLREWGLVRAEQGRGTYVRAPCRRIRRRNTERYQWEKDRALLYEGHRRGTGGTEHDTGLATDDLKFHAEYARVPADDDMANAFVLPVGTPLLRRVYWTSSRQESAPLSVSYSYLPYDLVKANPDLLDADNEPWPGGTQHNCSPSASNWPASSTRYGHGHHPRTRPNSSTSNPGCRSWPSARLPSTSPTGSWKSPTWSSPVTGPSLSTRPS
ncbi:hypothetical protein GCM10027290_32300 [Micromonospora sonneratiae]